MNEEKTRDYLAGRAKDLATRAYMNNFVTHTDFLSVSEQALFYNILASEKIPANVHEYHGAHFVLYGGNKDAERAMVCFLPDYMDEESFIMSEQEEPSVLARLRLR